MDFRWFNRLTADGVWFITRVKRDMQYEVVDSTEIETGAEVVRDDRVQLTGRLSRIKYPGPLRVVTIQKENGERFQFLTNNPTLAPSTIALAYRDRWEIENFFKILKQNLKIKSFLSTSPNAVWTQIWTAVIVMLLVRYLQTKSQFNWSFSNLVYFLRMNLFVYRDLWDWLHYPFVSPNALPPPSQFVFDWN